MAMKNFKLIEKRLSLRVTTILEQNVAILSGLHDCQNTLSEIQERTNSIETSIHDQHQCNKNKLAQANVQTKEQFDFLVHSLSNIFYPNNNITPVALATLAPQDPATVNPTMVLLPFPWHGNFISYGYANANSLLVLPTPRPFTVEGPAQPQPNQTHNSVGDGSSINYGEENFENIRKEKELKFGNHKIGKTTTEGIKLLANVDSIDLGRDISNPHMRHNMNVEKNKGRDLHPKVSVDNSQNSNSNSWNSLSSNATDNGNGYDDDSEEYSVSVSNSSSSDSISVTSVDREYNYSSQRKQKQRDISTMPEISSITVSLEI